MKDKFTHTGTVRGDAREGNREYSVYLRETKNFWVGRSGTKYSKKGGWVPYTGMWPHSHHLLLDTVRSINEIPEWKVTARVTLKAKTSAAKQRLRMHGKEFELIRGDLGRGRKLFRSVSNPDYVRWVDHDDPDFEFVPNWAERENK